MAKEHSEAELLALTPQQYRDMVRRGEWTRETWGVCRDYAVTDVVIIPKDYAYDYLVFSHRNPRALSIVDITEPGSPHPSRLAPDADLRTDLPRYLVYKDGEVIDEPADIMKYWRDDLVGFLMGCSGSFDWALKAANVQYRGNGVFSTNIPCVPYGPFHGNMAVSCRYFRTTHDAVRAIQISSRHFRMHGPPVQVENPESIGIKDLSKPDLIHPWGGLTPRWPAEGEVTMFWPCSATNRVVAREAKLPLMIVDHLRSMLMTNKLGEELAIL